MGDIPSLDLSLSSRFKTASPPHSAVATVPGLGRVSPVPALQWELLQGVVGTNAASSSSVSTAAAAARWKHHFPTWNLGGRD